MWLFGSIYRTVQQASEKSVAIKPSEFKFILIDAKLHLQSVYIVEDQEMFINFFLSGKDMLWH